MIQRISTDYKKERCTCCDELIENKVVAIMVEPESGYKLRYTDDSSSYDVSGFALINVNAIDTFDNYIAIEDTEDDKELIPEQPLAYSTEI